MALIMKRMWPLARCCACQSAHLSKVRPGRRAFSSASVFREDDSTTKPTSQEGSQTSHQAGPSSNSKRLVQSSVADTKAAVNRFAEELDPGERAEFDGLSLDDKIQYKREYEEDEAQMQALWNSPEVQSQINSTLSNAVNDYEDEEVPPTKIPRSKFGFMAEGEEDMEGTGPDDEFKQDDLSSLGHGNLDLQRDIREYARIAAWEMPLLSRTGYTICCQCNMMLTTAPEHAKPFHPPGKDRPLRFRYTTYLGEQHPAQRKVVVEFCIQDIPDLTDVQRRKLIKLVGARYNPETDIVKMSCESFEAQAQNKRYLGDVINTLLKEARVCHRIFLQATPIALIYPLLLLP